MEKLDTMHHPLLVAGFDTKSIDQSDPSTDAINTLTVTLRTSAHLLNGTVVMLEGLTGTQTPDYDRLEILGPFQHVFGSAGKWRQLPGTLVLRLQEQVVLGQYYAFSFRIHNPRHGITHPPSISISADFVKTFKVSGHRLGPVCLRCCVFSIPFPSMRV
jgi:hypothetical protein